jgi:hypothetical protein
LQDICTHLQTFATRANTACKYLQGRKYGFLIFADICRLANICKYVQISANICRYLHVCMGKNCANICKKILCRCLQSFADVCMVVANICMIFAFYFRAFACRLQIFADICRYLHANICTQILANV